MNAFQADIAFALTLISLVMGTRLVMDASKDKELCCGKFYKIIGYIAVVGSLLTLICVGANAYKEYKNPPPNMMNMMNMRGMMPRQPQRPMTPQSDVKPAPQGGASDNEGMVLPRRQ